LYYCSTSHWQIFSLWRKHFNIQDIPHLDLGRCQPKLAFRYFILWAVLLPLKLCHSFYTLLTKFLSLLTCCNQVITRQRKDFLKLTASLLVVSFFQILQLCD
jgi:hypothetical protein